MSHFYGHVKGGRSAVTHGGTKNSGYEAVAASWDGAVETQLWFDEQTGENKFRVVQHTWRGAGINEVLAEGVVGQPVGSA